MEADLVSLLDGLYRFILFGGLTVFLIGEAIWPYFAFSVESDRLRHVARNVGIWLVGYAIVTLLASTILFPFLPSGSQSFWTTTLHAPLWLQALVGLLVLDFANWLIHWLEHKFHWLWLFHAVHHSDPHLDVTTSLRFHPVEALLVLLTHTLFLVLTGLPLWVLLLRLSLAALISLWQHANIAIPAKVDAWLCLLLVSPNMHRVHHSPVAQETNSNYGVIFSFWDRLLGTYRAPSPAPAPRFGLNALTQPEWQSVTGMLLTPIKARRFETL